MHPTVMDNRLFALREWLAQTLPGEEWDMAPASADASFRRYFRVSRPDGSSLIAMDAPPDREDSGPFVSIAGLLGEAGVNAPRVLAMDLKRGFLLLTDLGATHYLAALREDGRRADALYSKAMDALLAMQARAPCQGLPAYDYALLEEEMRLFPDWFLVRHLGIEPDAAMQRVLRESFDFLHRAAAEQPRVFAHRDYHSRNLMAVEGNNPGVLDFQDAVCGPITYDLASLLKDVYIRWPGARVEAWALEYRDRVMGDEALGGVLDGVDEATWLRWFHLMGAQRHIKIAGIFARLHHRDGKAGYLADIPLTLSYLAEVCARYPALAELGALLTGLPAELAPELAPELAGART